MSGNKVLVVLKNWSSTVDKEKNKVVDYRAVYGTVTKQSERTLVLGDKLSIASDSIVTVEIMENEPPKEMLIGNWDMKEYKEIEAKSPIYIID